MTRSGQRRAGMAMVWKGLYLRWSKLLILIYLAS
jgi:hypothetical protein